MSSTEAGDQGATGSPEAPVMDMKLEVVLVPVSDVDRAKAFYQGVGFRLDADFPVGDDFRVVQLTPPGSDCAIILGDGVTSAEPGSLEGLQLVVSDIDAARAELAGRGIDVSAVFHDAGGVFHHAGTEGRAAGPAPEHASYGSWLSFDDPDGNNWLIQEVTTRLPGRVTGDTGYASASDLSVALQRAAAAHGEHEARTGVEDPDWPVWYAEYMVREQAGEELPT
jgi:catechol 2,3-dioxygenase-like lactoylglutathione lyase family enzyme